MRAIGIPFEVSEVPMVRYNHSMIERKYETIGDKDMMQAKKRYGLALYLFRQTRGTYIGKRKTSVFVNWSWSRPLWGEIRHNSHWCYGTVDEDAVHLGLSVQGAVWERAVPHCSGAP